MRSADTQSLLYAAQSPALPAWLLASALLHAALLALAPRWSAPDAVAPAVRLTVIVERPSGPLKNTLDSLSRRDRVGVRGKVSNPLLTPSPSPPVKGERELFQQTASPATHRTHSHIVQRITPAVARPAAAATTARHSVHLARNTSARDEQPAQIAGTHASAAPPSQGTAVNADADLLRLLHRAIDRHKRYPRSTRLLGGEGTTVVDFRLASDGTVSALRVQRSSGFDALDAAALAAVRDIAPFAPAAEYLHAPRRFQVSVVFRLRR